MFYHWSCAGFCSGQDAMPLHGSWALALAIHYDQHGTEATFKLTSKDDANKRTGNKQRHISNCKPKHVDQTNPRTHEADRIGMAFRFVCLDACLFLRLVSLLDLFLFVRSFGLQREALGTTNASRLHKQKQARTQTNRPGNKQK
jgi:hypothetical protein